MFLTRYRVCALSLLLIFVSVLHAQSPVDGLENQKKFQIVSYCGDMTTICYPGELTDLIFGFKRLGKVDLKQYKTLQVAYVVHDLDDKVVGRGSVESVDPGNGRLWVRMDPKLDPSLRGWFRVKLYVIATRDQQCDWLGEGHIDIAIIPELMQRVDEPYVGVSMPNGGGAGAYLSAANVLALQRLGVQQIRIFLKWYEIQPQENQKMDWRLIDRIVNVAHQAGIRVLPAVVGTPDWAVDPDAMKDRGKGKRGGLASLRVMRPEPEKFAAFLHMLVNRYKDRVHEWSIWNEPNAISSLNNGDPADYAIIMQTAYTAIKQTDPNATVAMAGISGVKANYLQQLVVEGAAPSIQAVCVHPYRYAQAIPEMATPGLGVGYGRDTLLDDLADVTKVINAVPATRDGLHKCPLWATEGGYNTLPGFPPPLHQAITLKQQAQYLVRVMALANVGGVSRFYWWRLFDTFGANMGIITNQETGHQPKPAYVALAVFERLAGDMHDATHQQDGDVHLIHYTSRGLLRTLAWTTSDSRTVQLDAGNSPTLTFTCTEMMGQEQRVTNLTLTPSPVYLLGHVKIKP